MDILDLIQEINFTQLNRTRVTDKLIINKPMIIHLLPDFGSNSADLLLDSGLRLMNCAGIITVSTPVQLGPKRFNGKEIFLYNKDKLTKNQPEDNPHKSIRVFDRIPKSLDDIMEQKRYVFVDHTIIARATSHIMNLMDNKRALFFLIQQLKKQYLDYKNRFPLAVHNTLFLFKKIQNNTTSPLYELVKLLMTGNKNYTGDNLRIFDDFILSDISGEIPYITPLVMYNSKGKVEVIKMNIQKLEKNIYYKENTVVDLVDDTKPESKSLVGTKDLDFVNNKFKFFDKDNNSSNFTNLKNLKSSLPKDNIPIQEPSKLKTTNISKKDIEERPILNLNQDQLTKIFKKYKIRDKAIADNIKSILNTYLLENPEVDKNKENIEKIILMSINKTIFNKDDIDDQYLQNPQSLFSKLLEANTYSKNIEYPEIKGLALQPKNILNINRVSGVVRHEYEFSDNIHDNIKILFKSLENRSNSPIKILNFKYDYEDNNLNRVINYQITLKNLTGGFEEPYTVNIKIPSLVNDRYFKLNGKNYILSNQQFFQPLTKTEPDETRLLSSYGMLTLSVVNLKINLSEISTLIKYINNIYPEAITDLTETQNRITHVKLKDKSGKEFEINQYDENIYKGPYDRLDYDTNTGKFVYTDQSSAENPNLKVNIPGKAEFLYEKLVKIIQTYNPNENLKKSPKSIPYLQVHLSGTKLPLIIYLWQQLGLLNALTKLGISYEIHKEITSFGENEVVPFTLTDGILYIHTPSNRDKLIVNGLLLIVDKKHKNISSKDLNINTTMDNFIIDKNSSRAIYNLNISTVNLIDPRTAEILEYNNMPTNVTDIICQEMIHKLLNSESDSLTDLKIYRSRQAELMFNILYKELNIGSVYSNIYKNKSGKFRESLSNIYYN